MKREGQRDKFVQGGSEEYIEEHWNLVPAFEYKLKGNQMERRPWTPYEDQVLKNLFEKVRLNKWSLIARRMEEEFKLAPRSGKQCRER